jgi:hypothetical protein
MPRLNIEDTWWTDPRRYQLARLVGSKRTADGLMLEAWLLAQSFWGNGRKKIPLMAFLEITDNQFIFDCDLAVKHGGFVYVRGTRQYHEWYATLKESSAKGGKLGGKRPKRKQSGSRAEAESLTLTPTLTLTLKEKNEIEDRSAMGIAPQEAPPSPSSKFIGSYVKAYQAKYGAKARPDLGGKTQGGIKRLLADTPVERACDMIQVYLQMDDAWFKTKAHDFETFAQNLTKIGLALDTGREIGKKRKTISEMLAEEEQTKKGQVLLGSG